MSSNELKSDIDEWCKHHDADCQQPKAGESGPIKILLKPSGTNRPFIDVYAQTGDQVILQKGMYIGAVAPSDTFIKGPRFLRDGKQLADFLSELS
ncbi:MAG: hypothetical protein JWO56_984 [Acidobacteria bacterium]|nr:hypothetical protein [Acidobacteriota bacterium]